METKAENLGTVYVVTLECGASVMVNCGPPKVFDTLGAAIAFAEAHSEKSTIAKNYSWLSDPGKHDGIFACYVFGASVEFRDGSRYWEKYVVRQLPVLSISDV